MEDGRIFLKSRPDTSFNKDLSNEPTFRRIHLAGHCGHWTVPLNTYIYIYVVHTVLAQKRLNTLCSHLRKEQLGIQGFL
jgi:hypothetical protein